MKFGLIPEFVGRLPVIATLEDLDEPALKRILTEPKNALVKQYQRLFEMEDVELTFSEEAVSAIAASLVDSIGEDILLNGRVFNVGASIGISSYPENGDPAARETPTLEQYLQTHDRSAIHQRLGQGLGRVGQWLGDRGGPALAALLTLLAGVLAGTWLATPRADHAGQRLHPETATQALFVIAVTAAYGLIAAWDAAVLAPDHLQALIGPLALSLVWGCESLLRRACRRGRAGTVLAQGYRALLWALLLWQALPLLPGLRSAP